MHRLERLVSQISVNRVGSVADQQAEVHDLAGFAGLHDDAHLAALRLADEVVMHSCAGEQRWYRRMALVDTPIRQNQNSRAGIRGFLRLRAKSIKCLPEPLRAVSYREGR